MNHTARAEYQRMKNRRTGLEKRWEKYAAYTLPRLYTPDTWDEDQDELAFDWQSVGAQAVNHVVNKLMLALFAPSRPFMRLEADPKWLAALPQGVPAEQITEALSAAEIAAVKEMDSIPGTRAKLYLALANLCVLGNVCMFLPKERGEPPKIYSVAQYVLRRTGAGDIKEAVIRETLRFDELEPEAQEAVVAQSGGQRFNRTSKVEHFRYIHRTKTGGYEMTQWIDNVKLPEEFDSKWADADSMGYRFLVWNLKDGNNYGTGLVEDYSADFGSLSTLSEAQIKSAVLASEYRWLVNPNGNTKVDDLHDSENGAAIPGNKDDVTLISNSKASDLAAVQSVANEYVQRIGRGFLLGSATTRDAERVTAAEIRMQATELETSFGGTYSNIAMGMQLPLATWLLRNVRMDLKGTKIKVAIITGLDALSRSGDLDALRAALQDLSQLGLLKEAIPELNRRAIIVAVMAGHGIAPSKYILSPEEVAKEQEARQQAAINQQTATEAVSAGVDSQLKGQQ